MLPSQMCKSPFPCAVMHPPDHHGCWLLNCARITSRVVLLLSMLEDVASIISKKNFKFWFVRPQNTFTLPQSILNELGPREGGSVSGSCLSLVSSLHFRVLTCICRCSNELSCTVEQEMPKFFSILCWAKLFLNYCTIFLCSLIRRAQRPEV